MNLKKWVKLVLTLLLLAGENHLINAAAIPPTPHGDIYLVYSGTATDSIAASNSPTVASSTYSYYLVLDLGHNSYSLMSLNAKQNFYVIYGRVLSADGTTVTGYLNGQAGNGALDPVKNFFWGLTASPKKAGAASSGGYAAMRFNIPDEIYPVTAGSSTENYPYIFDFYATGPLTGLTSTPVSLVPANPKPKVTGVYTINAVPTAITNLQGDFNSAFFRSYPTSLSGPFFRYGYDPVLTANLSGTFPPLFFLSVSGTISLKLDPTLTALANVGGSYKLKGQTVPTTINPIAGALTSTSSPTVYDDFLYPIAMSQGLASTYVPSP